WAEDDVARVHGLDDEVVVLDGELVGAEAVLDRVAVLVAGVDVRRMLDDAQVTFAWPGARAADADVEVRRRHRWVSVVGVAGGHLHDRGVARRAGGRRR